jgi:hypothetical protein
MSLTAFFPRATNSTAQRELRMQLLWLVASRAVILFVGLNIAEPLGLLPFRLGSFPFLPFLNLLTLLLTLIYTMLWWSNWNLPGQLCLQVAVDLCLSTLLVAHTRGVDSALVSLYVLIIVYCSLTMGRNAGMIGAALSTILYAGIIAAGQTGIISAPGAIDDPKPLIYRASINAFAFFAVAFLGCLTGCTQSRINSSRRSILSSSCKALTSTSSAAYGAG